MNVLVSLSLMLTSLVCGVGSAWAQNPFQAPPPHQNAPKEDKWSEFDKRWMLADLDNDGQLNQVEAKSLSWRPLIDQFEFFDANKDSRVSKQELQNGLNALRKPKILNFTFSFTRQRPPEPPEFPPPPPPNKDNDRARPNFKSPDERKQELETRFRQADLNNDGGLSREELRTAGMTRHFEYFEVVDTNQDGKITLDEIYAAIQNHMKQDRRPPPK